jgi:NAD(P)H-hydrate epimerase
LDAARLGAHLHGMAGDFAADSLGQYSMIASDILDSLPEAFMTYQGSEDA